MKALVTGGRGFIGSHLVEALITGKNHDVVIVDKLSPQRVANLKSVWNSQKLLCFNNLEDVAKKIDGGFDYIFHLGGKSDFVRSLKEPALYHEANVTQTLRLLEFARAQTKLKKFVFAASGACYGIPSWEHYPTSELAPCNPQNPYALTKYIAEQYVLHWRRTYNLPVISLRLFNIYGTRSKASPSGAVFALFMKQKIEGKPFTIVGDGDQQRDFTYVTDAAKAFIMAAESDYLGEIFNVGSGKLVTINRIIELLGGSLEKDVIYLPSRGEPSRTQADITKIRNLLAWQPEISIKNGIQEMLRNIDSWK
jgi:UDP-glucose 4-epimerase